MTSARFAAVAGPALCLLALSGRAEPPTQETLGEGAALASVCSGCHGDEESSPAIPGLQGLSAETLAAGFRRYKSESDGSSAMHRLARGYSDAQIQAIADYLAAQ